MEGLVQYIQGVFVGFFLRFFILCLYFYLNLLDAIYG